MPNSARSVDVSGRESNRSEHTVAMPASTAGHSYASAISDADVHERVKPAMQTLAEKMWSGTTSNMTYEQFQQVAREIGEAPGTYLP